MKEVDQAKRELVLARNLLMTQRDATSDAEAVATLQEAIEAINGQIQDLNQADLLAAAAICAGASEALDRCVADARLAAFGGFTRKAEAQAKRLRGLIAAPRPASGPARSVAKRAGPKRTAPKRAAAKRATPKKGAARRKPGR